MSGRVLIAAAAALCIAWPCFPQTAASLAAEGEKALEQQDAGRAREAFERALELDPRQFTALSGLGFLDFSQGRFAAARLSLDRALKLRPNSFQARFLMGAVLVELREGAAAIEQLRAAHRLNPAHADARKLLATEYNASGQYRETIGLLRPVVDSPPYDEEFHLLAIAALQAAGDSAASAAMATRAASRFPRSPQVAAWLGFQYQFSGRYEAAQRELQRAIELDPAFGVPYQLMGEICLKREEYGESVRWYRQAAERMPEDIETLIGLGRALAETGETGLAFEALRTAARLSADNAQVHLQLSRLYFRTGDEENARKEAALSISLRSLSPQPAQVPSALRGAQRD